jgi:hypothetical protein
MLEGAPGIKVVRVLGPAKEEGVRLDPVELSPFQDGS